MHWQMVPDNGFGDAQNFSVASFIVFNDMLYAGTGNNYNAQIWRSSSGKSGTWNQVAFPGPGFPSGADSFAVYNGALYAAIEPTGPENSLQVWRSYNGNAWVSVIADGFGDPANISPGGFAQFDGYLYLGIQNKTTGAQLWRTRDGRNWKQVIGNGFGDLNNGKIESLRVWNGYLYATADNSYGIQVWRSVDGMKWEPVASNGFGDSGNGYINWNSATTVYQGQLLIGTWNFVTGGELWMADP